MSDLKTKFIIEDTEFKFDNEEDMTFSGYLSVFNNVDSYGDVVVPGAFKSCLRRQRKKGYYPPMLEQHGSGNEGKTPIGVWTKMEEDNYGLYVEGKLFSTTRGKDFYTILKQSPANAVGMSIGYVVVKSSPNVINGTSTGGLVLSEIDLREGSIVTFPANDCARINNVKEEADMEDSYKKVLSIRDLERLLKDKYELSSKKSKELISELKDYDMFTFEAEKTVSCETESDKEQVEEKEAPNAPEHSLKDEFKEYYSALEAEEQELKKRRQIKELISELSGLLLVEKA